MKMEVPRHTLQIHDRLALLESDVRQLFELVKAKSVPDAAVPVGLEKYEEPATVASIDVAEVSEAANTGPVVDTKTPQPPVPPVTPVKPIV